MTYYFCFRYGILQSKNTYRFGKRQRINLSNIPEHYSGSTETPPMKYFCVLKYRSKLAYEFD